jgi:hypothetical protein
LKQSLWIRTLILVLDDNLIHLLNRFFLKIYVSFSYKKSHSEVKLSGTLNHVVTCKLIISNEYNITMKFGQGWTTFCQLNNIFAGNRLKFTCDRIMEYNNVLIVTLIWSDYGLQHFPMYSMYYAFIVFTKNFVLVMYCHWRKIS